MNASKRILEEGEIEELNHPKRPKSQEQDLEEGELPRCVIPDDAWEKLKVNIVWGVAWESLEDENERLLKMSEGIKNEYEPSQDIKEEALKGVRCDLETAFDYYWGDSEMMYLPPLGYSGERKWSWDDLDDVLEFKYNAGSYRECSIFLTLKLKDGRFIYGHADCDTSGWDCQSGGRIYMAMTREDIEIYGKS